MPPVRFGSPPITYQPAPHAGVRPVFTVNSPMVYERVAPVRSCEYSAGAVVCDLPDLPIDPCPCLVVGRKDMFRDLSFRVPAAQGVCSVPYALSVFGQTYRYDQAAQHQEGSADPGTRPPKSILSRVPQSP